MGRADLAAVNCFPIFFFCLFSIRFFSLRKKRIRRELHVEKAKNCSSLVNTGMGIPSFHSLSEASAHLLADEPFFVPPGLMLPCSRLRLIGKIAERGSACRRSIIVDDFLWRGHKIAPPCDLVRETR
jgi:hypothetical protein